MGKMSREKGKRGERQCRDVFRDMGCNPNTTYRACQFSGKAPDNSSADVMVLEFPEFHLEVKNVERLNLWGAYAQAKQDCGGKMPMVAHTKNQFPFLITLSLEDFIRIAMCSEYFKPITSDPFFENAD